MPNLPPDPKVPPLGHMVTRCSHRDAPHGFDVLVQVRSLNIARDRAVWDDKGHRYVEGVLGLLRQLHNDGANVEKLLDILKERL